MNVNKNRFWAVRVYLKNNGAFILPQIRLLLFYEKNGILQIMKDLTSAEKGAHIWN